MPLSGTPLLRQVVSALSQKQGQRRTLLDPLPSLVQYSAVLREGQIDSLYCRVPKIMRLCRRKQGLMDKVIETGGEDIETGVHFAKDSETDVLGVGEPCRR